MPKTTKYVHRGMVVDAEQLSFKIRAEGKLELELEDGTLLTFLVTPQKILRLSEHNAAGEPIYVVQSNNALTASVPPDLIKAPEEKKAGEGNK